MNNSLLQTIKKIFPQISEENLDQSMVDLGLYSFDLLLLRNSLEAKMNSTFSDEEWLKASTIREIASLAHYQNSDVGEEAAVLDCKKEFSIGMPQMMLGGLSEHWFFKELGDIHWSLISKGLETSSSEIVDGLGNRLYATFVRVRCRSNHSLQLYQENECLQTNANLFRRTR